jgi:hypothetical protein
MTCRGSPRGWAAAVGRHNALGSESRPPPPYLGSLLGRPPPGMPALGMPKLGGFPQVCAGCAACGCFWLNDSEEVRLDKHAMDVDTAEALAGVVGLLRQAAATDRAGARSPGQLFAFGVDQAATRPGTYSRTALTSTAGASRRRTGRPADVSGASVGGLRASLDSYHLDLVVAVFGQAGSV